MSRRGRVRERGQGLVEFAMLVPVFMLLLLGMLEFGFVFDHTLTIQYASREGARVGSALANGGGKLGCPDLVAGGSPDWETVDPLVIAAVNRVLTSPGSRVTVDAIPEIRIYKAGSNGQELGPLNIWTYNPGAGPAEVDGKKLDFQESSVGWKACDRSNGNPADSIGVSLTYTYQFVTPLGGILRFFGGTGWSSLVVSDRTVMSLNPTPDSQ